MNNLFLQNADKAWSIEASSFLSLSLKKELNIETPRKEESVVWREYWDIFTQRPPMKIDDNGIAHIHVFGVLLNKESEFMVAYHSGTNYDEIIRDIKKAETQASAIILHIDSPGGISQGNQGVVDTVANCKIPVFAYTDGYCCSAAYNIASQASYISATPDAIVGSIGVILPLIDVSALWQAMGYKADYITNKEGDLKAAGAPPSQNEAERAALQSKTQAYFELFKANVTKTRELEDDSMRGQAFLAKEALERGLIEAIESKESAYKKLSNLTKKHK